MRAFQIHELNLEVRCGVHDVEAQPTSADDCLIKVDFSGVNYKDALVATAKSRVRRVARLVGGVDAAGEVLASSDPRWPIGARVAVHGGDLGVGRDGGFAQYVYAPTAYLSSLPATISTRDAMIIGTAGFTAMASVLALEDHGMARDGEVLVTGATGGVGSMAITLLALRGYRSVASTGSLHESQWLRERGAERVIGRDEISDRPERLLARERWAGAVDCVGGDTLHQILRSLRYGSAVAASGLVSSAELTTNVYPFITRAVSLLGIDAVEAPASTRQRVWSALGEISPRIDLEALVDSEVRLENLMAALTALSNGSTRGRILVDPNAG